MAPSKRFKPVQRVAKSREQNAAKELGNSQRNVRDQESKLEELKRYHREYLEQFESSARQGMSASQLLEYRAFISKLELAIAEQEKIVLASKSDCSTKKEQWQHKHVRTKVLNKVMDRYTTAENRASEKKDQKETDDRNQRGRGRS
ncbi:MAG: flagellar export protein FliJ [Chromatiales bacterium]|nr:flagellar export protein FliJ [Chromatiales bacterium]